MLLLYWVLLLFACLYWYSLRQKFINCMSLIHSTFLCYILCQKRVLIIYIPVLPFWKKKKCSTLQLHVIFHFECRVCSNIVKLLLHILTLSIQLTVMVGSLVQCGLLFFMDMGILHAYTCKFLCPICLCTFLSGALLSNI